MSAASYDRTGLRASATTTPTGGTASTQNFVWESTTQTPRLLMDSANAYIYGTSDTPIEQVNLSSGSISYLVSECLVSSVGLCIIAGVAGAVAGAGSRTLGSAAVLKGGRAGRTRKGGCLNSMGGHEEGRPAVFRNRPYVAIGWGGVLLVFYLFYLAASSIGGGGAFGVAVILGLVTYFLWLIGCCSAVRMNRSGMIVDDVLTRHMIPWGDLQGIEVRGGLIFEVRGLPPIRMLMYGGSLYGLITGYTRALKPRPTLVTDSHGQRPRLVRRSSRTG